MLHTYLYVKGAKKLHKCQRKNPPAPLLPVIVLIVVVLLVSPSVLAPGAFWW